MNVNDAVSESLCYVAVVISIAQDGDGVGGGGGKCSDAVVLSYTTSNLYSSFI